LLRTSRGFVDEGPPSFRASPRYTDPDNELSEQPMSFGGTKPKPSQNTLVPLREVSSNAPSQSKPLIVLNKVNEPEESFPQTKPFLYFNDNVLSNNRTSDKNLYNGLENAPSKDGSGYKDLRNMAFDTPTTQILPESREIVKKPTKQLPQQQMAKKKEQPRTPSSQLSFEEKQPEAKKPSKPNIHGKYEMFNGFYSDVYYDNFKLRSKNNQINKVLAKNSGIRKKKRVAGKGNHVLTNPADPNTFIVHNEEADKRPPAFTDRPHPKGGQLEDEQINYKPRKTPPSREDDQPTISWENIPRRGSNVKPTSRYPPGIVILFVLSTNLCKR
jgi:hypothetical protein